MYTETSLFFLSEFNIMDGQARLLRCQIKEIRSVKEFLEHFNIEISFHAGSIKAFSGLI